MDRLEELLGRGSSVPFSNKVVVDREMLLNVIDQMRISIPEEIKEAKRLLRDREKEISGARDEAARIISEAREDAARLTDDHEVRAAAKEQASRMIEEARATAQDIVLGADDYASEVLRELAEHLDSMQSTVYNGLSSLERRRSRPEMPQGDSADEEEGPDPAD